MPDFISIILLSLINRSKDLIILFNRNARETIKRPLLLKISTKRI